MNAALFLWLDFRAFHHHVNFLILQRRGNSYNVALNALGRLPPHYRYVIKPFFSYSVQNFVRLKWNVEPKPSVCIVWVSVVVKHVYLLFEPQVDEKVFMLTCCDMPFSAVFPGSFILDTTFFFFHVQDFGAFTAPQVEMSGSTKSGTQMVHLKTFTLLANCLFSQDLFSTTYMNLFPWL